MTVPHPVASPLLWRADLLKRGFSPDHIRWALTSQRWLALRRGVYVESEAYNARPAHEQHVLRAWALHQSLTCDHVFSHHTALAMHGLMPLHPLTNLSLTTARSQRRTIVGAQVFTTRDIDLHRLNHPTPWGIALPTTSLARSIVDIARTCDLSTTLVAAEAALAQRLLDHQDLDEALDALPRWPGTAQAAAALAQATNHCDDPLLSWCRGLLITSGLPNPLCATSITHRGQVVGCFDFVWPDRAVIVMLDRTDVTAAIQLQRLRDHRQQDDLMREQGFTVLHITTTELMDQTTTVIGRIKGALARVAA